MAADKKLSADHKKVLKALKNADAPIANKEIAATSGMESKQVSNLVKTLKGQGLVDSPARCKYAITPEGTKVLS